jgi:hypothetical protein
MTLYHQQRRAKLDFSNLRLLYQPYRPFNFGYDEYSSDINGGFFDYRVKTASTVASLVDIKKGPKMRSIPQLTIVTGVSQAESSSMGLASQSQKMFSEGNAPTKMFSFGVRIEELRKLPIDSGDIKIFATIFMDELKQEVDKWVVDGFEPGFDFGTFGLVEAKSRQDHICLSVIATPGTKLQVQVLVLDEVPDINQ